MTRVFHAPPPAARTRWTRILDLAKTVVQLLGATFAIIAVVGSFFVATFGIQTTANADAAYSKLQQQIEARETREHAAEQHAELKADIDQLRTTQIKSLDRIEGSLERVERRLWEVNNRLKQED